MTLSVYVAGASSERHDRAKPVTEALRNAGFAITHDWTMGVDMHGANNEHGNMSPEDLQDCANQDLWGVRIADIFVLLAPEKAASTGAWVELGYAFRCDCHIFIAGKCDHCIFSWLPRCTKFETDAELVEFLLKKVAQ